MLRQANDKIKRDENAKRTALPVEESPSRARASKRKAYF